MVNQSTATFTFAGITDAPIKNLKMWYNDPAMIGKHFLVYSSKQPRIKRQYTICSSMNAVVKNEILKLAQGAITSKPENFDYAMMLGQDQSEVDLTLKTYNMPKGLSTRIMKT